MIFDGAVVEVVLAGVAQVEDGPAGIGGGADAVEIAARPGGPVRERVSAGEGAAGDHEVGHPDHPIEREGASGKIEVAIAGELGGVGHAVVRTELQGSTGINVELTGGGGGSPSAKREVAGVDIDGAVIVEIHIEAGGAKTGLIIGAGCRIGEDQRGATVGIVDRFELPRACCGIIKYSVIIE